MEMHRCRIEPQSWDEPEYRPAPDELERLLRVLRVKDGTTVAVFDGQGRSGQARLTVDPAGGAVRLQRLEVEDATAVAPLPVVLFQAIPKSTRMDWLVEKATELGVSEIVPLVSERCIVRAGEKNRGGNRLSRWRRLAQQAARQCGLAKVPDVAEPLTLEAAMRRLTVQFPGGLYGSLEADAMPLRRALAALAHHSGRMALFIGPEGDFTPRECGCLRAAGMLPIDLGPRILRVETAALAALCLIGHELRTAAGTW